MSKQIFVDKIIGFIKDGKSVVLVGEPDSGKTHFVNHDLEPALKKERIDYSFLPESLLNHQISGNPDLVIADEFETLFDKERLENKYPNESPYYSNEYLDQVKELDAFFASVQTPVIFIITRTDEDDVDYLFKNLKKTDSNKQVEVVKFRKQVSS